MTSLGKYMSGNYRWVYAPPVEKRPREVTIRLTEEDWETIRLMSFDHCLKPTDMLERLAAAKAAEWRDDGQVA